MGDMKDKMKGLIKKVTSSSSGGKFKGQGRVLGGSSSSSPAPLNPIPTRHLPQTSVNSKPTPQKAYSSDRQSQNRSDVKANPIPSNTPENGFDPFDSLITTGKRNKNGYSLEVYECPVCGRGFGSPEEVSDHVEICLNGSEQNNSIAASDSAATESNLEESRSELEACVGAYLSGKPSDAHIDILLKLLKNIVREPGNVKFRKIRMGNPKIKEAIVDVPGCVELLEIIGFKLQEEAGELWAVMDVPSKEQIAQTETAISFLEPEPKKVEATPSQEPAKLDEPVEPKKIDRQVRVFSSVSERVAARIELPDSFYKLTVDEVKRDAEMRRKKLADSQLLVPKSLKEKQTKAARKRYTKAVIRVQFPDGVVLQGFFSPREPTTALYEFVSSALKNQCLEFELLHPVLVKRRMIPNFGEKPITLEDEELVPSALIKFRPLETDSVVFTGLSNEFLEIMENLASD
jgi:UBX domain-containing protein 6